MGYLTILKTLVHHERGLARDNVVFCIGDVENEPRGAAIKIMRPIVAIFLYRNVLFMPATVYIGARDKMQR